MYGLIKWPILQGNIKREKDTIVYYNFTRFITVPLEFEIWVGNTAGLELARVPRVLGTRQNSEHHLWHPRILRLLILTRVPRVPGTRQNSEHHLWHPQSSFYVTSGTLSFKFLTQALSFMDSPSPTWFGRLAL